MLIWSCVKYRSRYQLMFSIFNHLSLRFLVLSRIHRRCPQNRLERIRHKDVFYQIYQHILDFDSRTHSQSYLSTVIFHQQRRSITAVLLDHDVSSGRVYATFSSNTFPFCGAYSDLTVTREKDVAANSIVSSNIRTQFLPTLDRYRKVELFLRDDENLVR